jgi:ATP-dependent RNA helicase DDX55/SPB4
VDEWDELAHEERMYKKFRRGKISKAEYEREVGERSKKGKGGKAKGKKGGGDSDDDDDDDSDGMGDSD